MHEVSESACQLVECMLAGVTEGQAGLLDGLIPTMEDNMIEPYDISAVRRPSAALRQRRRAHRGALIASVSTACAVLGVTSFATTARAGTSIADLVASTATRITARPASLTLGTWVPLPITGRVPGSETPAVFLDPGDATTVLWAEPVGTKVTYDEAVIGPAGNILVKPTSIFGTSYWVSLSSQPTIVAKQLAPHKIEPLVIFSGERGYGPRLGCITGAVGNTVPWAVQGWSLAAECISDQGGAAETATGQLSAAWAAGPGILYRIGTSPIVPPATKDSQIALGGGVPFRVAEAVDVAGNDDVYVAWAQQFSHAKVDNGYYVKDVSSNGPVLRAPGSGTNSVNDLPEDANLAIASTNTHKGVFLLYCNNAPTCTDLLLWRVGAPKAIVVPGSAGADAFHYALSTGPDGRLWLAWYSHSTNDVSTVRTNMADTAFGPVETYTTPCFEDGLLGLSGGNWGAWGSWGLLDVVLQCVANSNLKETDDYTQSLTALGLTPTHATVDDAALFLVSHQVRYTVTDAGDPVAGALVTVAGMYASTNVAGQATFTFPKTLTPGEYPVDASASLYIDGRADLTVLKK